MSRNWMNLALTLKPTANEIFKVVKQSNRFRTFWDSVPVFLENKCANDFVSHTKCIYI